MSDSSQNTVYKQHLRERIIDTAIQAFAAHGVRSVKMDEVSHALSISKRTVYELFDNKEDLLFAGVQKYRRQKEEEMVAFMSQSPSVIDVILYAYRSKVEESKNTNPQFYADITKYPRVMELLEENKEYNRKRLSEFLMRGVNEGYFRHDIDYSVVVYLFDAIGHQVMSRQLYKLFTIEQLFMNLVFISIRGICTPLGAKLLDERLGLLK